MNDLTVFNFESQPIRTYADENGEPWFCLSDTCTALNISRFHPERLPQKGVTVCTTLTRGGNQELTFVNEPNLYRLVFRSNKPEAQKFADWVYSDVLPSIRKTGGYQMQSVVTLNDLKKMLLPSVKKEEGWETSTADLITCMQNWFYTQRKAEVEKFRALTAENEQLKHKLLTIKTALGAVI